jgi:hypothetical protein
MHEALTPPALATARSKSRHPPENKEREPPLDVAAAIRIAAFRSEIRMSLRKSEQIAQASGLTPQRHLLLLMIMGAPDGSEQATVTELTERLQLAR